MVTALANSVTTALRSRSHTLQGYALVNKHTCYEELTILCLTLILLFPVGNGRAEQFLNVSSSSF